MKNTRLPFSPFLLLLIIVLSMVLTNLPDFHPEKILGYPYSPVLDMSFHGGYYFVITLLVFLLLYQKTISILLLCTLLLIPALFEFSQTWIPGRSVSAHDLIANYLGIIAALLLCFFCRYFIRARGTRKKET